MKLDGPARELVGSDLEFPEFDPWGFTKTADEDKIAWYDGLQKISQPSHVDK